ncbi:MAG: AAA family ATPase, partial [Chloroflexi bacterium]|nr:AAA family ATPase [Chloroflexota bacterium]
MNERAELFGRASELALIGKLVDRAAAGEPTTLLVDGPAGIGKTRLLLEIGQRVRGMGGLALTGAAPPTSGEPMPFAAISALLRDALRQLTANERSASIERSPSLGHLQLAWRADPFGSPPPTSSVALSDDLVEVVDGLASDRPLVVLLVDDVQWADPTTLDLLAYLARAPRESRVLLVIGARLDEVAPDAPLRRMRAELLRIGAKSIALGPLPSDAASELLAVLLGADVPARRSAEIAALGGGNPLFLYELAETGAAASTEAAPLPESLVALTRARLTGLTATQLAALQVVTTVGDGCTEHLVVRAMGQPESITVADIATLVAGRMLTRGDAGALRPGSPVLREVVLGDTLEAQLRRIRSAAAKAMAADPTVAPGTEVERLIRVANLWDGAGDPVRALPALVRAAEAAEDTFAFATAFDLYAKALRIVDAPAPVTKRRMGFQEPAGAAPSGDALADLRGRAANAAILAGDPATAIDWMDAAVKDIRDNHARDRLLFIRARAMLANGDADGAVATYRGVRYGDHGGEIVGSARIGYARALTAVGEASEAVAVAATALVEARESGSRSDEETALLVLGTALTRSGNLDDGIARIHEATTLRQQTVSPSRIQPRASRVMDLTAGLSEAAAVAEALGLTDQAELLQLTAAGAAKRWGAAGESSRLALRTATFAFHDGRWDEALHGFEEAAGHPGTAVAALAGRARIGALRGAWERAAADLARGELGT